VKVDPAEGANGDSNGAGLSKASDHDAALGGASSFDPKLDLHYRNCSEAGIFTSVVVSQFHVTFDELTEGILS